MFKALGILGKSSSRECEAPCERAILVVDDVAMNRDLLERWIHAEGYTVYTAATGDEALAIARARRPALVLLDIMIPNPNGFDVCEQLKKDRATRDGRVVLMTGLQHPQNSRQGAEVGCDGFLTKPLSQDSIRTVLEWAFADRS